jgi:uracil-DNA glycosylase family 4
MIFTDRIVKASGPKNAKLAAIGMSPQKWELADGIPFTGPSGKIFNEALAAHKFHRQSTFVTNMCNFFIDDNDLYSVPKEIMDQQRTRIYAELEQVKPNILLIMGGDTLWFLTGKQGIQKWRGSIFELQCPSGRKQKCVAAMHPAAFIRGQWKWLPIYKYIDVQRAVTQSSFPEIKLTERQAIVGPSFRIANDYLRETNEKEWVSIDYEGRSHITCLGVGWSGTQALCVPLNRVGSSNYWTPQEEVKLWKLWCDLLENPKVKKIAQNAAYEWIKSWLYGIYPNPLGMDTMHMHHCLYPDFGGVTDEWSKRKRDIDNPGHGLALITSQYTDQPFYKDDGRHWLPEHGEEAFWRYNCLDVMVTFESAMKMKSELQTVDLWDTYQQQYVDVFEDALRMEWNGIAIDVARRDAVRIEMQGELFKMGQELKSATGYDRVITKSEGKHTDNVLNLASPKQMQHFLYEERKYKVKLHRKTGKITVDKDTLQALAIKHDDGALKTIIKMKQIQDLMNDVIDARLDDNNRIHCHHKLGGTNGTRWSTTESILGTGTNLQNLPRQGVARSLFLPN